MPKPLISVCVPAYNRPITIARLIQSFLAQDCDDSELIVADDSTTVSVMEVVCSYNDPRIRYHRNTKTQGYCINLRKAILAANGKYLVTMGDDDFFIESHALSRYIKVFESNPDVIFVDCNKLQVRINGKPDMVFRSFTHDEKYQAGEISLKRMWGRAAGLPGLSIRNIKEMIVKLYPRYTTSYPQSILVGKLLINGSSYAVSDFLVCSSSHEGQLGYLENRDRYKNGHEKNVIFLGMAEELGIETGARDLRSTIGRQLASVLAITLPNEKLRGSTRVVAGITRHLMANSKEAAGSPLLWLSFMMVIVTPKIVLRLTVSSAKALFRIRERKTWEWYHDQYNKIVNITGTLADEAIGTYDCNEL